MARVPGIGEDFFIIGGGMAGLMTSIWLRRLLPGTAVTLIEKGRPCCHWMLRKGLHEPIVGNALSAENLAMAGGGPPPALLERALAAWPGEATLGWLRELDTRPQLSGNGAIQVDGALLQKRLCEAACAAGVRLREHCAVQDVRSQPGGGFRLWSAEEALGEAAAVVFATGGERNHGMALLRETGPPVATPRAGFLRLRPASRRFGQRLEGLSREVRVTLEKTGAESVGRIHCGTRGLEGPVMADLSARSGEDLAGWRYRFALQVDWVPQWSAGGLRKAFIEKTEQGGRQPVGEDPLPGFSVRHWNYFLEKARVDPALPWPRTKDRKRNALIERLKRERIPIEGMGLPAGERAWQGGVDPSALLPESGGVRGKPGLYCCGEMLDFLYPPGGYQASAVWASAYHTATGIAGKRPD